ncbi:MAG: hypothetical protein LC713_04940 [Actinobacteria bacterium]|nr:hypothetical protein [Actinomycetota bacterium]
MLGTDPGHDWLFLCDAYGARENGTYYMGEAGDLYVERAMLAVLAKVMAAGPYPPAEVVMAGSSMGATAALKFGLLLDVAGILAVCPHIDLDICAARQDRQAEVAFILPSGGVANPANHPYTRQIRRLLAQRPASRPLPHLVVQSCEDDPGVHDEQVLPLVDAWRAGGGTVWLDARPVGGHTSDYATKAMMLDAIGSLMAGDPVDVRRYQTDPRFAGSLTSPPMSHRLRRAASLARKRVLGR